MNRASFNVAWCSLMQSLSGKPQYDVLIVALMFILSFAAAMPIVSSQLISLTGSLTVVGTRSEYPWPYRQNYTFLHNTSLVFEAPQIVGWTFDYTQVNFGCNVGGVTGSNVSNIFAIDNGYIQVCQKG